MTSCIDMSISMGELRNEFEKIYPFVRGLHMNIIAEVMFRTDFKKVNASGMYYDFYAVKHIMNRCKIILNKANELR